MNKIILAAAIATFIILFSGCLSTLYPIFTEKDLVYKPELLGKWQLEEETIEITSLAMVKEIELPGKVGDIRDKGYLFTYDDDQKYIVFLARIGKHLYFDYYPVLFEELKKSDAFFLHHFTIRHTSYRVNLLSNNRIEMRQLDGDFLETLIKQKKIRIRHEIAYDGEIVISASTAELQQYIIKYGDEPGAQGDKKIYTKIH